MHSKFPALTALLLLTAALPSGVRAQPYTVEESMERLQEASDEYFATAPEDRARIFGTSNGDRGLISEWTEPDGIYEGMQIHITRIEGRNSDLPPDSMAGVWWLEEPAQGSFAATFDHVAWNGGRPFTPATDHSWAYQRSADGESTNDFSWYNDLAYQWVFDDADNPTRARLDGVGGPLIQVIWGLVTFEFIQVEGNHWERVSCWRTDPRQFVDFEDWPDRYRRCEYNEPITNEWSNWFPLIRGDLNYSVYRIYDQDGNTTEEYDIYEAAENMRLEIEGIRGGFSQGPSIEPPDYEPVPDSGGPGGPGNTPGGSGFCPFLSFVLPGLGFVVLRRRRRAMVASQTPS